MASIAPEQPVPSARPGVRAIAPLLILSSIAGLNAVDRNMFGLLLPAIKHDIALSDTQIGFLVGPAFVIVYSVAGVPLGWAADRIGRRSIIAAGLGFWSLVTAAMGLAGGFVHLLMLRLALGVGEASNLAPTSALISDRFAGRTRVLAMAVFSAGGPFAILLFYPLIGWVAETHGWRDAFPLMGIVGLAVAAAMLAIVRESPRPAAGRQAADALPFAEAARTVLSSVPFWLMVTAGTLLNIDYSAFTAWLPSFMARVHGLDARTTGVLIGTYKGGLGVIATLASGFLVAFVMRFDRRWLAWAPALCCFAMAPGQLLLLLADNPIWWHVGLAIETVAMAATTPCTFALVLSLVDARVRATGTAAYLLVFNLVGQSVGPLLVGALNDHALAGFGAVAIRYSLLTAPAAITLSAIFFLILAGRLEHTDDHVEQP